MNRFLRNYAKLWWVNAAMLGFTYWIHVIFEFRLIGPGEMVDIVRGYDPAVRVLLVLSAQGFPVVLAVFRSSHEKEMGI